MYDFNYTPANQARQHRPGFLKRLVTGISLVGVGAALTAAFYTGPTREVTKFYNGANADRESGVTVVLSDYPSTQVRPPYAQTISGIIENGDIGDREGTMYVDVGAERQPLPCEGHRVIADVKYNQLGGVRGIRIKKILDSDLEAIAKSE